MPIYPLDRIVRSRAPLRLGLAGGGTDVSPYCDTYGGAILNATINLFARTTLEPAPAGKIILDARDLDAYEELESAGELETTGPLKLLKGVYNRIIKDYQLPPLSLKMTTYVDVPKGSGLGSSSTIVTSIIGAFAEWLNLPLGEYEIAHLAYEIERLDLGLAGGRQDQYAATFGGFNFMEFYAQDKVIVNPLRIKPEYKNELEFNLLLYYTGTSRESANIIDIQRSNFTAGAEATLQAAHGLKEQAIRMKEAILRGQLHEIGLILDYGWEQKKRMAQGISNTRIDDIYGAARAAGAIGGKISGAGGGGFFTIFCPGTSRFKVQRALESFGGQFLPYQFTEEGMISWSVPK